VASTIITGSIFIKMGLLLIQLVISLIKKAMMSLEATMIIKTDISNLRELQLLKKSNESSQKIRIITSYKKKLKHSNHLKKHLINA
jgi:hypothetical protein